ncbi:uncharacterized protein (UPF0335 family) [Sphingobium sp. B1D3A]|uniref:Uncharacterized protein (UPF0335 family) n=1 Tax=Sphingobium lignivorans TaxID=2735886 RepID=A0ABR6NDK7_9SPHN|nr:uncharacterized protein (UPF0335 family) [Sphingobium lignivorans]
MSVTCARCDRSVPGAPDTLPPGWVSQVSTLAKRSFTVCDSCGQNSDRPTARSGDSAADELRLLIERIERLEEEKKGNNADIKDVYAEAKARGYDVKVMREVIKRRAMDGNTLREFEAILDTYMHALNMGVEDAGRPEPEPSVEAPRGEAEPGGEAGEPGFKQAVNLVVESRKASASWLQRQLRIGYNSAARLIERMEAEGIVSAPDHVGRRMVLRGDE